MPAVHACLRASSGVLSDNEGAAHAAGRAGASTPGIPGPNPYRRGADGIMIPRLEPPDTDPTPTLCQTVWEIGGPCQNPAEYACGVVRTCGCVADSVRYYCEACITTEMYGCLYCRQQTTTRVEPVRLRVG